MRSLIDIVDFSVEELDELLYTVCDISEHPEKYALIVGIMAYFGYNFLTSRVSNLVNKMEHITIEFLDMVD